MAREELTKKLLTVNSMIENRRFDFPTIISFHRMGSEGPSWSIGGFDPVVFERIVRQLSNNYSIVTMEELAAIVKGHSAQKGKYVALTFDDGYSDNYSIAYKILKRYGVSATFYITTELIGNDDLFWWDKLRFACYSVKDKQELVNFVKSKTGISSTMRLENYLKSIENNKKIEFIEELFAYFSLEIPANLGMRMKMNWDQIKEMCDNEMEIGSHTRTHPILTRLTHEEVINEIVGSKKIIEERLNRIVHSFCYPNGKMTDYNSHIVKIVKNSGYSSAVTSNPFTFNINKNIYKLGRIPSTHNLDVMNSLISNKNYLLFGERLYSAANKIADILEN